jgi:hypothetical protein
MSIKDHDHNRTRIICTRMKESGACDHRCAYYLDKIERVVVERLRERLGTKPATEECVRKYNELRRLEVPGSLERVFERGGDCRWPKARSTEPGRVARKMSRQSFRNCVPSAAASWPR